MKSVASELEPVGCIGAADFAGATIHHRVGFGAYPATDLAGPFFLFRRHAKSCDRTDRNHPRASAFAARFHAGPSPSAVGGSGGALLHFPFRGPTDCASGID